MGWVGFELHGLGWAGLIKMDPCLLRFDDAMLKSSWLCFCGHPVYINSLAKQLRTFSLRYFHNKPARSMAYQLYCR